MFWILWINARNLHYINKFNKEKEIWLANNKLKTKNFLSKFWIPLGDTYTVINSKKSLREFDFLSLQEKEFIVKPNKWSKWRWIAKVKVFSDPKNINELIFLMNWKNINKKDFIRHMDEILDWVHSWWDKDSILIEELLTWWEGFEKYCKYWLADIRVIVFHLVPIAAMIRVPTEKSWWRANLAQGGLGLWLNITSWIVETAYLNSIIYNKNFPGSLEEFEKDPLPYWDSILSYSSHIQFFVNLWYLALDWVITENWPKLLEINARAWLEIQNVCWMPLMERLNRIKNLKIKEPDKGFEICKTLFSSSKHWLFDEGKIMYLSQWWSLVSWWKNTYADILIETDINRNESVASSDIVNFFNQNNDTKIMFENSQISISPKYLKEDNEYPIWTIKLWLQDISNYFIRPKKLAWINKPKLKWIKISEIERLILIDDKIEKIWKKLNLSSILRPINFYEEFYEYQKHKFNYNPKFKYNFLKQEELDLIKQKIEFIEKQIEWSTSKIFSLYKEKLDEFNIKLLLLKAYSDQDFDNIAYYNNKLFWEIDPKIVVFAEKKLMEDYMIPESKKKILELHEFSSKIKDYLKTNNFQDIKITLWAQINSRVSVTWWLNPEILISKDAVIYEFEVNSILAHEIWVHLLRGINGTKTWLNLLKIWTAFHLADEEWLAIINSEKYLPENCKKIWHYKKYLLSKISENLDFKDVTSYLRENSPEKTPISIFKWAFRVKKWIIDCSNIWVGTIFRKDHSYLKWYLKIQDWIENWWDIQSLMIWKIKTEDLKILKNFIT